MEAIVSPSTTERIVRTSIVAAMFAAWCGWFLYDGYIRYPAKNQAKAVER